jgi:hypothetical protein
MGHRAFKYELISIYYILVALALAEEFFNNGAF